MLYLYVSFFFVLFFYMSVNSLIPVMARIRERLQLDGRLCDFLSNLGLNDGAIDAFLEVDEAPIVAHRLPGQDVSILHEIRVPHSVSAHDIVHVHADGVADSGWQGRCGGVGGGPGLACPG